MKDLNIYKHNRKQHNYENRWFIIITITVHVKDEEL